MHHFIVLNVCRDNVVAEVDLLSNADLDTTNQTPPEISGSTGEDRRQEHSSTKLSEAMERMETTCTNFKNLYNHDLKGWVDRTATVETNSELEETTKELRQVLSNIHETTASISTIRSCCNGIASKSRELDEKLSAHQ